VSRAVLDALKERFGAAILETHSSWGDETAVVEPSKWRDVAQFLRSDPRMAMNLFVDLCGVDYPDREPRIEVVCHLRSIQHNHRVRIKARIGDADGDGAELPSLVPVWAGANWFERETYDMFGVRFIGHPDLRRILLYDEFEGFPLRKDYPANRTQPLIPFRDMVDKLPPFGPDMGMSFGRQIHAFHRDDPLAEEQKRKIVRDAARLRASGPTFDEPDAGEES
jgi:NADH-quinone oxidoreductase subunit C